MTTIIRNVSRVTSAGRSEELAESHVKKTTRLATEDSIHREETRRECSAARTNVVVIVMSTISVV
jgi:hypothetical protein